jgi:hypothetical protein
MKTPVGTDRKIAPEATIDEITPPGAVRVPVMSIGPVKWQYYSVVTGFATQPVPFARIHKFFRRMLILLDLFILYDV